MLALKIECLCSNTKTIYYEIKKDKIVQNTPMKFFIIIIYYYIIF